MAASTMTEVMGVIHRYAPKGFVPKVGMILGSGLSLIAEQITNAVTIPYQAIPGLQGGTVPGHASLLVMGWLNGVPVICMRGRLHLYEGVTYEAIRIMVRIIRQMGSHILLSTGAVGSMREEVGPGELMMITDHINFQCGNPLIGPNDESVGPRFVSMEDAYDLGLQDIMQNVCDKQKIALHKGIYISVQGPMFETPAEIRAFKSWGADVVGMSIVPEVIAARHCGLRVACLAAITNLAVGLSHEKVTHDGTLHFGELASRKMVKILPEFIKEVSTLSF